MLQYYLVPNHLTEDPDDYMAISSNSRSVTIEEIYDHMTREGSTITKAEALSSYEEITQGIINTVVRGYAITSSLLNISSTVRGSFRGEEETYIKGQHSIHLNVTAGLRLEGAADKIEPQKIAVQRHHPTPEYFYDHSSDTKNQIITPDGGARITGSLLSFDEEDGNQGIFFINKADESTTRVNTKMLKNKPSELIFIIPNLPAGTYRLEVYSILRKRKSICSGFLPNELTVR